MIITIVIISVVVLFCGVSFGGWFSKNAEQKSESKAGTEKIVEDILFSMKAFKTLETLRKEIETGKDGSSEEILSSIEAIFDSAAPGKIKKEVALTPIYKRLLYNSLVNVYNERMRNLKLYFAKGGQIPVATEKTMPWEISPLPSN